MAGWKKGCGFGEIDGGEVMVVVMMMMMMVLVHYFSGVFFDGTAEQLHLSSMTNELYPISLSDGDFQSECFHLFGSEMFSIGCTKC